MAALSSPILFAGYGAAIYLVYKVLTTCAPEANRTGLPEQSEYYGDDHLTLTNMVYNPKFSLRPSESKNLTYLKINNAEFGVNWDHFNGDFQYRY